MNLVWKLLRSHISIGQFAGFLFANLCGMIIVLFGIQFYNDIIPVFTQEDSFMKVNYIMLSKRVGTGTTISGQNTTFTIEEEQELKSQAFVEKLCTFTSTAYRVNAHMGINGQQILSSEMYFEAVPDEFVDINKKEWIWNEGDSIVPIILPRTYINMYNFGFANSHNLPKISEGLMGMIDFRILILENGNEHQYKGRVVGFSSSLSSILVPLSYIDWTNKTYAQDKQNLPTRLLVQVSNPADKTMNEFLDDNGYEIETDKLDQEKTTYFLRLIVLLVLVIGLIISVLSFYILMLSIYLLVQKNTTKLENLMLIGYTPSRVARPYQLLTISLNASILIIALVLVALCRNFYIEILEALYPDINIPSMMSSIITGASLFIFVSVANALIIYRKMLRIWYRKS